MIISMRLRLPESVKRNAIQKRYELMLKEILP
jgi:hypothetical protein